MPEGTPGTPIDVPVVVSSTPAALVAYLDQAIASNLAGGGLQEWKIDSRKSVMWDLDQMISVRKYYAGLVATESRGGAAVLGGLRQNIR